MSQEPQEAPQLEPPETVAPGKIPITVHFNDSGEYIYFLRYEILC